MYWVPLVGLRTVGGYALDGDVIGIGDRRVRGAEGGGI